MGGGAEVNRAGGDEQEGGVMNRREFLRGLFALGVTAATARAMPWRKRRAVVTPRASRTLPGSGRGDPLIFDNFGCSTIAYSGPFTGIQWGATLNPEERPRCEYWNGGAWVEIEGARLVSMTIEEV